MTSRSSGISFPQACPASGRLNIPDRTKVRLHQRNAYNYGQLGVRCRSGRLNYVELQCRHPRIGVHDLLVKHFDGSKLDENARPYGQPLPTRRRFDPSADRTFDAEGFSAGFSLICDERVQHLKSCIPQRRRACFFLTRDRARSLFLRYLRNSTVPHLVTCRRKRQGRVRRA